MGIERRVERVGVYRGRKREGVDGERQIERGERKRERVDGERQTERGERERERERDRQREGDRQRERPALFQFKF